MGTWVLFVDDLHWADPATTEVLGQLIGHRRVVLTCRPGTDLPGWTDRMVTVVVGPLCEADARSLARRLHPTLDDVEIDRLVSFSAGNPLLVSHLSHDGAIRPTLRAAVAARLELLPDAVRDAVTELACSAARSRSSASTWRRTTFRPVSST